jgi:preprotein translocase subunit SecG
MTTLFLILIILACVVLTLIVLVQNPKGGGLAGNVAGLSNQFMGVKQTTDVLEKGTWIFAALIALICLISTPLLRGGKSATNTRQRSAPRQRTKIAERNALPGHYASEEIIELSILTLPPRLEGFFM